MDTAEAPATEVPNAPDRPLKPDLSASGFRPTYAAFGNDLVAFDAKAFKEPLTDALGNAVYARHLAQLIVAKKTPLPLSLGLFGDWGAGKSYFMRLLHQEIDLLSARNDEVFCRKVVQIHFNAWHYLDTNLWA
ncbi:MAG: P-loop NTPase fold protein, partial [Chthoniobacteraceae bacterium]